MRHRPDQRYALKNRTLTALSCSGRRDAIGELQVADALEHLQRMQPGEVVPWRWPSGWLKSCGVFLAGLLACLLLSRVSQRHNPLERIYFAAGQAT